MQWLRVFSELDIYIIRLLVTKVNQVNQSSSYKYSYRSEIDGLRAFAVLSVVAFHAFPSWLRGGFIGVDVFFVISGFLITTHIFEKLDKGQFSFSDFFGRRIRRIFPALILVMACSLAFGWFVLLADEFAQLGKHVASGAAFIINFNLVDESGYFDNAAETKPMLHLWSLAVEEQFYIVWPLVLWLAWKRKFNLLTITIVVAVISFYLNLRFVKSHPTETFFWPVGRFWEFLSGSILAWLLLFKSELLRRFKLWVDRFLVRIIYSKDVAADGSTVSNLMSFFGLLLLAYSVIRINESLSFPSKWALIPVLGTLLVIASGSKAWPNRLFLMKPLAVWFGLISYPLYLWHWPILSFLQITGEEMPNRDARIAAVLLSILLAWLTYKFIEKPIRFGSFKRKVNSALIVFVLFSVGGVGYYVSKADWYESNGYEDVIPKRKSSEFAFGNSLKWFKGKESWLFLGNAFDQTVEKLLLPEEPNSLYIEKITRPIKRVSDVASDLNIDVALLVGPNKSSVYGEFLPSDLVPSKKRHLDFYLKDLREYPNLTLHDPTYDLIKAKSKEGMLYFRTGTHYNNKGAYISFIGLLKKLNLDYPKVNFKLDTVNMGDAETGLIERSNLTDFPIPNDENWTFSFEGPLFKLESVLFSKKEANTPFGSQKIVLNNNPISGKRVWVVGDSFTNRLRPFLERTFAEVHYIGHWHKKNKNLPAMLIDSEKKPDLVLIVKVERSF
jgi:peptidoglycan/LPS O-acetylase OafA/YrhL